MVADQFQRTTTDAPPKQVVFGVIGLTIALDMARALRGRSDECKVNAGRVVRHFRRGVMETNIWLVSLNSQRLDGRGRNRRATELVTAMAYVNPDERYDD